MEATIEPGPSPVILIAVTWPWPFGSGERGCDPDSASRICVGAEDAASWRRRRLRAVGREYHRRQLAAHTTMSSSALFFSCEMKIRANAQKVDQHCDHVL
jgi:hypothetical protein